jgi:hypothetical protein
MAFIYDLTDTWNAGGTAFNGIKMNVTDTASAAASRLLTLQVGGVERFGVRKDGQGYFAGNVGIGITAPRSILSAASATGSVLTLESTDTTLTTNDVVGEIDFYANDGSTGGTGVKASVRAFANDAVGNNIALAFATSDGNSLATDRMVITGPGNVGIGTSAPAEILHLSREGSLSLRMERTGASASVGSLINAGNLLTLSYNLTAITFNTGATPAERARIDSSGNLLVATSTASATSTADGFVVSGATSALMSRRASGANQNHINFVNNGVSVGRIDTSTTATSYSTSSTSGITGVDANTVAIRTNSAERMRVTDAGRVGIGTTTPAAPLHVAGAGRFGSTTSQTTGVLAVYNDGNDVTLEAFAGNSEVTKRNILLATYGGNVGIGTNNPSRRLTVSATGTDARMNIVDSDTAFATATALTEYWGSDGRGAFTGLNGGVYSIFTDVGVPMNFLTAGTERMRITSGGDVGINVSTPLSELDVRGVGAPSGVNITSRRSGDTFGNSYIQFNAPRSGTADGATVNGRGSIALLGDSTTTAATLWLNVNSASLLPETADEATMQGYPAGLRLNTEGSLQFWDNGVQHFGVTAAGRVGIGTNAPSTTLHLSAAAPIITLTDTDTGANSRISADSISGSLNIAADVGNTVASSAIFFFVDNTERMRLTDAGSLLVATTTPSSSSTADGLVVSGTNGSLVSRRASGASQTHVNFVNNGVSVGTIVTSTTATTYNTSSDARLKHDIVDAPEASNLIDAIKVRSFKWNADDSEQRYGFVAQELVEVAPEAVSVPTDEDQMMGVDYSKLVPMLVKEIQSLRARVAQLEGN